MEIKPLTPDQTKRFGRPIGKSSEEIAQNKQAIKKLSDLLTERLLVKIKS